MKESIDWVSRGSQLKPTVRNFVNGKWSAVAGPPVRKFNPRDGSLLVEFGAGDPKSVDEAVTHARRTFNDGRWSGLSIDKRKAVLYRLAELIERQREEFALLECLDVGKPIREAFHFDVPAAVAKIKYSAESADKLYGSVYAVDHKSVSYELLRSMGVVAAIVGWNFPLLLAITKIGPALVTGNSLVLKPSEMTSLSAARVSELALEAGLPEGVLNVIHGGPQVGEMLAKHGDVDLVTFTGSTRTGKKLLIAAGQSNMKRLLLECGGKAPNIIFDDLPNLDRVADAVVRRAFYNQGEVCSASSRLLVHEGVKENFLALLMEKSAALGVGDPLLPETQFGALVTAEHRQKVLGYIEVGEREGARAAYRSKAKAPFPRGFYVPPVIFDDVLPHHTIAQEEIFGPVLSVLSFRDETEAINIANSTIYGLSAILWTKDIGRAHRVTQGIRAGWIVVNATGSPSGSIGEALAVEGHKQSGMGTEGGLEGLKAYTSRSVVQVFS